VKKTATGLALLAIAISAGTAAARNFHCAGGIQYVIQGTKEKDKGNLEDAHRIFGKAVAQLRQCTSEDPNDNESWSYLGWALAEQDSAAEAGAAFDEAEKRLVGNTKALTIATQNRKSYWVNYYNAGLSKYKEADAIIPVKDILNSTDAKVADAKAKLAESEVSFRKAVAIAPRELSAYNNLAIVLALQGNFKEANAVLDKGLAIDANNQELKDRKNSMNGNAVTEKIKAGDYTGALDMIDSNLAGSPNDYNQLVLAAQTSYEYAQKLDEKKDAGTKAAYERSMAYYGRAASAATEPGNKKDMTYNQAIAAQNAGKDLESAKLVWGLVQDNPKDKALHGMLRGAYDRMGSKKKADDEVWVILGLNDTAVPVADLTAYIPKVVKTSDAGKTLAAQGTPEEVRQFKSGETQIDLWYYWTKKQVFAFAGGRQVGAANWGEFGPEAPTAPGTAKTPAKAAGAGAKG
jgi:tetratricopeptide (TPR) repeat protein